MTDGGGIRLEEASLVNDPLLILLGEDVGCTRVLDGVVRTRSPDHEREAIAR